ncbi:MAG: GNAT family N-acetyltransferase [Acidisphaera sp.]|nr:GNAT family N-acetyltransferase [Acidisphaera sp.]
MQELPNRIVIERVTEPTEEVRLLIGELEAVLSAEYPPEQRHGLPLDVIFRPHIRFFVARSGGEPAGCGGVALFDTLAEVKRMYVREAMRGRGIAPALLARIEHAAREAGHTTLRLETGDKQHAAMAFYRRSGFLVCDPFGEYRWKPPHTIATSVFMEKPLTPVRQR